MTPIPELLQKLADLTGYRTVDIELALGIPLRTLVYDPEVEATRALLLILLEHPWMLEAMPDVHQGWADKHGGERPKGWKR